MKVELIFPAYYLLGHSIELSLKSFLSAKGYSHSELRKKKYGHDLDSLLSECTRRKLGGEVRLSKKEVNGISLLNKTYCDKKFEYLEYGNFRLPEYSFAFGIARKLLDNLNTHASNSPLKKARQGDAKKRRAC